MTNQEYKMNTLTIKLKQHTPLIHFQHDQDGATLRASDVKPKLDKFILAKLSPEEKINGMREGWIKTKGDKVWLDYKMRIEASNVQNISMNVKPTMVKNKNGNKEIKKDEIGRQLFETYNYPDNSSSLIMSNIGGRVKDEVFNFSMANYLLMTIMLNNEKLTKVITSYLNDFFGRYCFGNRGSKGFGSFELKSINGKEQENYLDSDSFILSFTMKLDVDFEKSDVYKDVFKIIQILWKKLKNISEVRGKAMNNVLLKVSPQHIGGVERIPSPICFKPLIDFYVDKGHSCCDVNIVTLFDLDVIKQVTGSCQTSYFENKLNKLKDDLVKNGLYAFLRSNMKCEIKEESVQID